MRLRRTCFVVLFLAGSYVAIAACSSDPPSTADNDAGNAAETSAPDTSAPPVDAQSDSARSPELTGLECKTVAECYAGLDAGTLKGEAVCLTKVQDGYCTHKCQTDDDCCAVPGECKTGLKQVCASFENQPDKYCFLSCEESDIANAKDAGVEAGTTNDAGAFDGDLYCHTHASAAIGCRSTGGGASNRKVCLPSGGGGGNKDAGGDAPTDAPDGG
jgi:hypothetical protein